MQTSFFAARHWIYNLQICILSLAVALFDTRCSIVYKFTFLSRTTDSFNILHFCRTMLKFLWNLHFCRWLLHWLCIYIFAVTLAVAVALFVNLHFRRVFCIAYKFRFLPLAVALHFAACSCIAYVFFLFCKFAFLPLAGALFEHLHFVAHYCIVLEQTIDYITEATRQ